MIQSLQLQHVRSHQNSLFSFNNGVNIIVGPNASGKTNALEAIHMLHSGQSFRSSDSEMISFDDEWARIDGSVAGENRSVKLAAGGKKSFEVADVEYKRLPHRLKLPVSVFDPSHLLLLSGDPERRRRYVDDFIAQVNAKYDESLRKYRRALQQRNRLLKSDSVQSDHMFVWDVQLCEHAGIITRLRDYYINILGQQAAEAYQSISLSEDKLSISIDSKLPIENYADSLAKKLRDSFDLDRIRGYTGNGPHRDDISFVLNAHDARSSASRGESRSIVLSLKLAEMQQLSELSDIQPIFLLDDVFSELDGKRRRTLADNLQQYQSFITTTDADIAAEHFSDSNVIPIT